MSVSTTKAANLAWLRTVSGELSTATLKRLDETLPWYRDMPPGRRSAIGLVAQSGIRSLIAWFENPNGTPWVAADVFGTAPRELLRSISLQQTLQLIRVVVEVVENRVADRDDDLREAVLLYSREIAFAAADVYARAAEARGLWDQRLEALVVDSILTGEYDDQLPSRIAALGWHGQGETAVLVGTAVAQVDVDGIRRTARHLGSDVLIGVQGSRLVVVLGRMITVTTAPGASSPDHGASQLAPDEHAGAEASFLDISRALADYFGPGYLVLGHNVPELIDANKSAKAAVAGFAVARSWRAAPRPVHADDLLPERALAGDPLARATLVHRIYRPLQSHSADLTTTLWTYLDTGRSLEATARELFVHPNTVRYRLKRILDIIGWDATEPRAALVLHAALIVGSLSETEPPRRPARRDIRASQS